MRKKNLSFPQTLDYVASKLGLNKKQFERKIKLPFGGFYKGIITQFNEPEYSMKTYDEDILEPYLHKYNTMFLNDGIDFKTQEKYCIGYDLESNRITVPIWTLDGKLCGIMGRLNDVDCDKSERWFPIIPCSRSLTLYGYHQNYMKIQEKGLAIVGESEKFTLQLKTMGIQIGLATSGCSVSNVQARHIKGLLIPKVILAYDEGLEEENIIEQAMKLQVDNQLFKNNVGYIWDENNEILPKGSKMSPSDMGVEKLKYLLKNYVKWI